MEQLIENFKKYVEKLKSGSYEEKMYRTLTCLKKEHMTEDENFEDLRMYWNTVTDMPHLSQPHDLEMFFQIYNAFDDAAIERDRLIKQK